MIVRFAYPGQASMTSTIRTIASIVLLFCCRMMGQELNHGFWISPLNRWEKSGAGAHTRSEAHPIREEDEVGVGGDRSIDPLIERFGAGRSGPSAAVVCLPPRSGAREFVLCVAHHAWPAGETRLLRYAGRCGRANQGKGVSIEQNEKIIEVPSQLDPDLLWCAFGVDCFTSDLGVLCVCALCYL